MFIAWDSELWGSFQRAHTVYSHKLEGRQLLKHSWIYSRYNVAGEVSTRTNINKSVWQLSCTQKILYIFWTKQLQFSQICQALEHVRSQAANAVVR